MNCVIMYSVILNTSIEFKTAPTNYAFYDTQVKSHNILAI